MARYEFEPVAVSFHDPDYGHERSGIIQPPPLDLPRGLRVVLWILRPVLRRVIDWMKRSLIQFIGQLNLPKEKIAAIEELVDRLMEQIEEVVL